MPNLSIKTVSRWFSMVRNVSPSQRDRVLECFWDTQLSAKSWLIEQLNTIDEIKNDSDHSIYIFGGWYGVLASMMLDMFNAPINGVWSIDLDSDCMVIGSNLCVDERLHFVTADMALYTYPWEHVPTVVINTSSEHVEQGVYDTWYDKIPRGTIVVVQSNNYYECAEHTRCVNNLREFATVNHVVDPVYIGELPNSQYTRYMAIWKK